MNWDNPRMCELRHQSSLDPKILGRNTEPSSQHLDRNRSFKYRIVAAKHFSHAAASQELEKMIALGRRRQFRRSELICSLRFHLLDQAIEVGKFLRCDTLDNVERSAVTPCLFPSGVEFVDSIREHCRSGKSDTK